MEKIKEALRTLFEDKVDDGGLDRIVEMIEVKIAAKADETLNESITAAVTAKEQELNESNAAELATYKDTLANTIDTYLTMAFNEFVEENKETIESNVMVEMAKTFMGGLTTIMKEHNIKIADSDVDVVADLESQVSTMKSRVEGKINENIELKAQQFEYEKAIAILTKTAKCTDTQREKVTRLIEDIGGKTIDEFNAKLDVIINEVITPNDVSIDKSSFGLYTLNEEAKTILPDSTKPTKADKVLEGM